MKRLLKTCWLFAVLAFALWAVLRRGTAVQADVRQIDLWRLMAAGAGIAMAKMLLSAAFRSVLASLGHQMSRSESIQIFNTTQLAKYLPGNIWHFVGKAAILRQRGLRADEVRNVIILETWWTLTGAVFFAVLTFGVIDPGLLRSVVDEHTTVAIALLGSMVIVLQLILVWFRLWHRCVLTQAKRSLAILVMQFGVWLCLGASFYLIGQVYADASLGIGVFGLYAFSWAVGFATPFAPGGIGVREAILTAALVGAMSAQQALVAASVHRLIYVLVEVLIVAGISVWRWVRRHADDPKA